MWLLAFLFLETKNYLYFSDSKNITKKWKIKITKNKSGLQSW